MNAASDVDDTRESGGSVSSRVVARCRRVLSFAAGRGWRGAERVGRGGVRVHHEVAPGTICLVSFGSFRSGCTHGATRRVWVGHLYRRSSFGFLSQSSRRSCLRFCGS